MTAKKAATVRPYAIARRGVWEDARVGKTALRVYLEMESAASKDRLCWLAVETIAKRLKLDERAVQKARKELVELKKIEHVRYRAMPGRGLAVSEYRMLGETPESDKPAPDDFDGPAGEAAPAENDGAVAKMPRSKIAAAPVEMDGRPGEHEHPGRSNEPPNQEGSGKAFDECSVKRRAQSAPHPIFTRFKLRTGAANFGITVAALSAEVMRWQATLEDAGLDPDKAAQAAELELWKAGRCRASLAETARKINDVATATKQSRAA